VFDTAAGAVVEARPATTAALYVCGITPYDATHIGHAATYLAYDTLIRLWLDAGFEVLYVQNTTDVDDPLLERANRDGVNWRDLAEQQTDLFRGDMESLSIIPPDHYVAVTDMVTPIADAVASLLARGTAYRVDTDVYFDWRSAEASSPWTLGDECHFDRATMLALSAERGGDPDRPGKRDALDPLLWRGARDGEPSWASPVGAGRPGWHIECSVIAETFLEIPVTVKGGGRDLVFPHHEFSAGHTAALSGRPLAEIYSHAGLVAYRGEKMSKSLGNLVFVSELVASGVDPRAIRLALLGQHYREDWEYTEALLDDAVARLSVWRAWAASTCSATDGPSEIDAPRHIETLRGILANDLDSPGAVAFVDTLISSGEPASGDLVTAINALLGIAL
jgi:L-cysteine:1D-myo-inositol 2-amino-2-deoxy-alpha-D-glucopyranoside ligase